LKPNWRWEGEEQALLTSCSSLITTVETDDSRVVQFSHFSVKEFLTSERLAISSGDVSRYHIDLEPAHTILAQACMSILLQPDDHVEEHGVDSEKSSPLTGYAAEHWVTHAQFERVSSFLRKAMEYLFDLDKPYFAAWLRSHDMDTHSVLGSSFLYLFTGSTKLDATPLYYAALCGFQDLVEHLLVKYPQHVNTSGGHCVTPLAAALGRRHLQTVKLLHHNGAHVDVRGDDGRTPLYCAAYAGDLEMVQLLLDYKADINARGPGDWTPIHIVSAGTNNPNTPYNGPHLLPNVARLLLEHGADVDALTDDGLTPLHMAVESGRVEVARVLLEHGANVGAEDNEGKTPFQIASAGGNDEIMKLLSEHGANGVL
jgi:hypothetical protein